MRKKTSIRPTTSPETAMILFATLMWRAAHGPKDLRIFARKLLREPNEDGRMSETMGEVMGPRSPQSWAEAVMGLLGNGAGNTVGLRGRLTGGRTIGGYSLTVHPGVKLPEEIPDRIWQTIAQKHEAEPVTDEDVADIQGIGAGEAEGEREEPEAPSGQESPPLPWLVSYVESLGVPYSVGFALHKMIDAYTRKTGKKQEITIKRAVGALVEHAEAWRKNGTFDG